MSQTPLFTFRSPHHNRPTCTHKYVLSGLVKQGNRCCGEAGAIPRAQALTGAGHLKSGRHCVLDAIPPREAPLLRCNTHTRTHKHTSHVSLGAWVHVHMCNGAATSPFAAVSRYLHRAVQGPGHRIFLTFQHTCMHACDFACTL